MKQYLICVQTTTIGHLYTDGDFEIHTSATKDDALFIIASLCYKTFCETLEQIPELSIPIGTELADFLLGNSADNQDPILQYNMFEQGMAFVYDDMNFLSAYECDEDIPSIGMEFHIFCQSLHPTGPEPVPEFTSNTKPVPVNISIRDIVNIITKLDFETINA